TEDAIAAYRQAVGITSDHAEAWSNLALCLSYSDRAPASEIFAVHREWDRRFGHPATQVTAHAKVREPERRLKIGYVSPDFRTHSVAFFLEPLLRAHDRQNVEVYCYADVARPDAFTTRLQACT